ncbi:Zn(2)-C6 fungal-type DNA-binding domain [Fusarium oxysporum f. sp. vasinfectum]|nr:Zn(2)-C6 fungal-type DNA-binding domain [Fusarium oxysporum f. sp. vasinfectum]
MEQTIALKPKPKASASSASSSSSGGGVQPPRGGDPSSSQIVSVPANNKPRIPNANVAVLDIADRSGQNAAKKPKTKSFKTRTGCKECKRRKVKCDEGKPICNRCKAVGLTCHFPLSQSVSFNTTATATTAVTTTRAGPQSDTRILAKPNYILSLFKDQTQYDMFSTFLWSNEQGTTLPHNTLATITPQLAHEDAAVRETCCALGGAVNAFTQPTIDSVAADKAHQLSLQYYTRTVRAVTTATSTLRALRSVTHVALVFLTYDILRGDMHAAVLHHDHAARLFEAYLGKRCAQEGVSLSDLVFDDYENALFDMIQRLSTYPWALRLGITGDTDEFLAAKRCLGRHRYSIDKMPSSFHDLDQALRWWGCRTAPPSSSSFGRRYRDDQSNMGESFLGPRKNEEPHSYVTASVFEALYLECLSSLHLQLNTDAKVLPDAKPVYREIIATTHRILDELKGSQANFRFMDNNVMKPLFVVLFKCSDPEIREGVKKVLQHGVAKFGSACLAGIVLGMMHMKSEHVPQILRNVERAVGWHLTSVGCGPGVITAG